MAKTQGDLPLLLQCLVQAGSEERFVGSRIVDAQTRNRVVHLLAQRRAVVEEDAIEIPSLATCMLQMGDGPSVGDLGGALSVVSVVGFDAAKALDEVAAINENCRRHTFALLASSNEKPSVRPSRDLLGGVLGGLDGSILQVANQSHKRQRRHAAYRIAILAFAKASRTMPSLASVTGRVSSHRNFTRKPDFTASCALHSTQ